jgi:hypothetical protein
MSDYDFNEIKQGKIDKYRKFSEVNLKKSNEAWERARKMADAIPLGQPILEGHHSEKADRFYRKKISRTYEQAFELEKKAQYYADKAVAAESNDSISSRDPEAVEMLKEKILSLETERDYIKAMKKKVRKAKTIGDVKTLLSQEEFTAYTRLSHGEVHIPQHVLTNRGAVIRNTKERLRSLENLDSQEITDVTIGDAAIRYLPHSRMMEVVFPGKPSAIILTWLKQNGFRWAPSRKCWSSNYNSRRWDGVKSLLQGVE